MRDVSPLHFFVPFQRTPRRFLTSGVLASSLLFSAAHAQDAPREAEPPHPPPGNPPPREDGAGRDYNRPGEGRPGDNRPGDGRNMGQPRGGGGPSRQVIAEQRRAVFETRLRQILANNGVPESEMQDAVIAYLASEESAKIPIREAARRLANGMRRSANETQLRPLLDSYLQSVENDRARRALAEKQLDEQIGFSKNLRLEILLRLAGVIGEGAPPFNLAALGNQFQAPPPPNPPVFPPREAMNGGTNALIAPQNNPALAPNAFAPNALTANALTAPPLTATPQTEQAGVAKGRIERKGGNAKGIFWIEVRALDAPTNAPVERYMAIYKPELRGFEPKTLALLANAQVGDWVEIEWFWNEHRRIVTLKAFQPETPAPGQPPEATEPPK